MANIFYLAFLALIFDRIFGEPQWLWNKIPHPVVVFGRLITRFDERFNLKTKTFKQRYKAGLYTIVFLVFIAAFFGLIISTILEQLSSLGLIVEALIASTFFAQKSLKNHVLAVAVAYQNDGLVGARQAVSMIVGRDPERLDENGVARAAIESLAENSSDGIVAPLFWFLLFGLAGLMAYKMLNTADSMIGHKNERYQDFGRAAAKLDDAANFLPARLSGYLIIVTARMFMGKKNAALAYKVMVGDAHFHRSPNAGWPESAYAGALDLKLAGPRIYDGLMVEEPFQNASGKNATIADIFNAIKLFSQSMNVMTVLVFLAFFIF